MHTAKPASRRIRASILRMPSDLIREPRRRSKFTPVCTSTNTSQHHEPRLVRHVELSNLVLQQAVVTRIMAVEAEPPA